jgi:hypothetical protein
MSRGYTPLPPSASKERSGTALLYLVVIAVVVAVTAEQIAVMIM